MKNQSLDNFELLLNSETVTFLADNCFNPIFFALESELLGRLTDAGKRVKTIDCDGVLPWCFSNPFHLERTCIACRSIRKNGHRIAAQGAHEKITLGIEPEVLEKLELTVEDWSSGFESAQDLLVLRHKEIIIGPGILSTLSFMTKEANPDLGKNRQIVRRLLLSSLIITESLDNLFSTNDIGTLVVGNGRLATSWAASRIAEKYGKEIFSYEILPMTNSMKLVRGSPVHDINVLKEQMADIGHALESEDLLKFDAIDFFEQNRHPKITESAEIAALATTNIYVKSHMTGKIPEHFDPNKRNIAVMTSSEWEYAALPGWSNSIGSSQLEILRTLLNSGLMNGDIMLWVRCHPDLVSSMSNEVQLLLDLNCSQLQVIKPQDVCDSYALMEACEKVITFGSTMGIEATYWGKPSILSGRAEYENLGAVEVVATMNELIEKVNEILEPRAPRLAYPYGIYRREIGIPFTISSLRFPDHPLVRGQKVTKLWLHFMMSGWKMIRKSQRKIMYSIRGS